MLEYGTIQRDPMKLPPKSLEALLQRGFSHFLGNEQASKIVAKIRTHIATTLSTPDHEVNQVDVTKDQINSFRAENAEQVKTWSDEVQASALKALDEGTIGVRAPGQRASVDPLTGAMRAIARSEVVTILKANSLAVPKGEATVKFGDGSTRTMEEMIAKRLTTHSERITAEAKKHLADVARKAKKVAEEALDL